jgi:hypothetical protein
MRDPGFDMDPLGGPACVPEQSIQPHRYAPAAKMVVSRFD